MSLKDFFTLTELKDGLTTPARINELLSLMHLEKDSVVKNVGEVTQNWAAVAKTIASTENKQCLSLFIQCDGLLFFDQWLNDAQKFGNDTENNSFSLEELITHLLCAIEKLMQVDNHNRLPSSGIEKTVQGLLGHNSSMVQEKAKALCDGWAPLQENHSAKMDMEMIEAPSLSASPIGNDIQENVGCPDTVEQKKNNKEEIPTQETVMESGITNQEPQDLPVDSSVNASENVDVRGVDSSVIASGNVDARVVESDISKSESGVLTGNNSGSIANVQSDNSQLDKHVEEATEKQEIAGAVESTAVSSPMEHETADIENDSDHAIETDKNEDNKDEDMMDSGGLQVSVETETDKPKTTSDTESDVSGEDAKKSVGIQSDDDSLRFSTKGEDGDLISKRASDMELDYGMVDPLELARQVANEVEREVDSRERSCSTSQNISERPSSPGSTNGKELPDTGKEVSSGLEPKLVNDVVESGQPEPVNDVLANAERGFSGFDLNQEFSSEETECPVLTPISRAAAADGLPVAPLQFEGTLGWKGSAATSAFRRVPEVEKTVSVSSSGSHKRLDFDLNVTEGNEDVTEISRDKMPITSFLEEASPRLQLDLNSFGDGDSIAFDWKRVASLRQQSPSLSASSSSIQPSFRNIDLNLNDHLTIPSHENPFLGKLFNNSNASPDESVISIFGTQVEVKRKDSVTIPNGRILDLPMDFSLGRLGPGSGSGSGSGSGLGLGPSMPYSNLPAYGHNGFALGPAMSMYGPPGPIPYMVDSRGAPIIPQLMGSSSSSGLPPFSQPTQPFFLNMSVPPSGSNGAGPSRLNNFDLNSGFMTDGGNRENNNGGLRQFLGHGVRPLVDEQQFLRMSSSIQTSSVLGGKRQEPDSGWETFPINYKHHQQPPWQ